MVRNVVVVVFFTDCNHFFNHRGHRVKSTENTKEFYKKVSRKDAKTLYFSAINCVLASLREKTPCPL